VLTVAPAAANLFVDDSLRLSATLIDRNGAVVSASMSWSVDNAAVARIDSTGVVRGVAPGSATIRVSARGQTASATLVVVADSGQTLSVVPNGASLYLNGSEQFTATLKDRNGKTLPTSAQWESSNPAVATVSTGGLVKGVGTGSATIQAKVRNLLAAAPVTVVQPPASVVLVGAGDISSCANNNDEATAKLLDAIDGTVFTAGDNVYENGTTAEFNACYNPTWGRHKSRTHPTPGNHEYNTLSATGYFDYFGSAAGDRSKGYYSYDLGAWHIIVLNSNLALNAGSPQETWLRADLAAHPVKCTLAMWHHPRFSSGHHGSSPTLQPLWQALYDAGADLVIVGHDHVYERFAPQTPAGQLDMARGIREFVVGTGGAGLYIFEHPAANSEVKNNVTYGVLKLTLYGDRYDWKFVPVAGSGFTDSGTGVCH
jgi:uncharacterized protein YjdB